MAWVSVSPKYGACITHDSCGAGGLFQDIESHDADVMPLPKWLSTFLKTLFKSNFHCHKIYIMKLNVNHF